MRKAGDSGSRPDSPFRVPACVILMLAALATGCGSREASVRPEPAGEEVLPRERPAGFTKDAATPSGKGSDEAAAPEAPAVEVRKELER